jgi:predicted aspartyl protease
MKYVMLMLMLTMIEWPTVAAAGPAQIIVPVTFTYHGTSITAPMAVDTGATVTTIGTRLAERLGVNPRCEPSGMAQMADGSAIIFHSAIMDVTVSTKEHKGLQVNIMDYSANRQAEGMLGLDMLSDMTMTIDWRNKRIYWSE